MRILVLGGTVFLSRAVAAEAVRCGHEVVCAARGASGSVPPGARLVVWDRADPTPPPELVQTPFDAVVDIARLPSYVRSALTAFPDPHWVFVSTVNVYADDATPGQTPATGALVEPLLEDGDAEHYGRMKVACEQLVSEGAASSTIVRPGLIVGPEDPTGRFTYWARRLAAGGEVLAPGSPADVVQVIDVGDLAVWLVTCAEQRTAGVFDGVGAATPIGDLLADCLGGVDAACELTWVDQDFLTEQGVEMWAGEGAVPLWLSRPAYDGMLAHDVAPSLAAGLTLRPVADSIRELVAWLERTPDAVVSGIDAAREAELLAAWHAR